MNWLDLVDIGARFALILLAGFLAYEKGNPDSKIPKFVCLAIYGLAIATLFRSSSSGEVLLFAAVVLGTGIGLSMGPGNAIGPALHDRPPDINRPEKWQVGIMLKNYWAALAGLGFIRAAFVWPILGAIVVLLHVLVFATSLVGFMMDWEISWLGALYELEAYGWHMLSVSVLPMILFVLFSTIAAPLSVAIVRGGLGGPLSNGPYATAEEHKAEEERSNEIWKWQDRLYGGLFAASIACTSCYTRAFGTW